MIVQLGRGYYDFFFSFHYIFSGSINIFAIFFAVYILYQLSTNVWADG